MEKGEIENLESPFLTSKELESYLRISTATLWIWRREGLPCTRVGRTFRYDLSLVLDWLGRYEERKDGKKLLVPS